MAQGLTASVPGRRGPAGRLHELDGTFRLLLGLAATATAGMAVWLFSVTILVLPARDPGHIGMWRGVAAGFLAYSALSWACLAGRATALGLRRVLQVVSLLAVAAGVYSVATMVRRGETGGHFEGYIVLMGALLCAHGLAATIHALLAGGSRRQNVNGDNKFD